MRLADAPPAGWYPDPGGTSRLRWWDGTDWADHYRARPTETELALQATRVAGKASASGSASAAGRAAASQMVQTEVRAAMRHDTDEIISQVREVARSEVERAADLFTARAKAATRELQPLISQYTAPITRWLKIVSVIAVVLLIAWFVFQLIAQQSLFDWVGDRIDNLAD